MIDLESIAGRISFSAMIDQHEAMMRCSRIYLLLNKGETPKAMDSIDTMIVGAIGSEIKASDIDYELVREELHFWLNGEEMQAKLGREISEEEIDERIDDFLDGWVSRDELYDGDPREGELIVEAICEAIDQQVAKRHRMVNALVGEQDN